MNAPSKVVQLFDRLQNLVTNLGTSRDKSAGNQFALRIINEAELEAMYRCDWLSRKIVDIIPQDMTREWRSWKTKDVNIARLEAYEGALYLQDKLCDGLISARLYGDAAIFIGISGDDPASPLIPENVRRDSFQYLHLLNRRDIQWDGDIIRDPISPYYGTPEYYLVQNAQVDRRVHPSRIIPLTGAKLPDMVLANSNGANGWGDSILQVTYDAVVAATMVHQTAASLVPESKLDVVHVPGLDTQLSTADGTSRLTDRFSMASMMKSSNNMLLLQGGGDDVKETWTQKQIEFTQLTDLLHANLQVAAGAADVPITRLLGQSPAGLNATGESDIRNYYDSIRARQKRELRCSLDRLDAIMIRSALSRGYSDIYYEFNPLWQMTETEKAEISSKRAAATKVYIDSAIVPRDVMGVAVRNQLIEDGSYPGIEAAYKEFETGDLKPVKLDPKPTTPPPVAGGLPAA